jgi:signal transduction histidine kinase
MVLFVVGVLTAGFIVGFLTLPASTNSPEPSSLVFQAPFYLFAITTLIALANSTRAEAALVNKRLEETTAELTWEVTKVLDEYRQLKRQLAQSLHGPIQTQLMSSLIKLGKQDSAGEVAIEEVKRWLVSEFKSIEAAIRSGQSKQPGTLKDIFMELGEIWEGVAVIRLNGSVSDAEALEADPRLMVTFGELIPELSFNAVRHGQASLLEFSISFSDQRTLLLSCVDNGNRPAQMSRVGLGTKLLDECAISWRRYSKDDHTHTDIELPFVSQASPSPARLPSH